MWPRPFALSSCAVLLLGGCCGDGGARPSWGRGGGRNGPPPSGIADVAAPFAVVRGQVDLEAGRPTVELGGTRVTPGGLVRAWLSADLDGDGDDDAVALRTLPPSGDEDAGPALELMSYRQDEGELVATGGQAIGTGRLRAAALRLDAPGTVTLTLEIASTEPPDPAATAPVEHVAMVAVLFTGPLPLRPRVSALLDGRGASIAMSARDRDGDGRADGELAVERNGARAEVVWIDRAAGPAVDPGATERSLQALLPPPVGRERLDADAARAQAIVEVRRLLCTGRIEGATLVMQYRDAHECWPSRATGQAISLLVRAHTAGGRVPQAREALSYLQMEGVQIDEQERAELERLVADRAALQIESEGSGRGGPTRDGGAATGERDPRGL